MRKNTLKSIFAALAVTSVAVSATAMSSYADFLGDNKEVAYSGAETFKANMSSFAPDGAKDEEYEAWLKSDNAVKPELTIDTIEVYEDEINKPVTVNFTMANASKHIKLACKVRYSSYSY